MISFLRLLVDTLFVFSVIFIWLMLLYQFALTIGGFMLRRKTTKEESKEVDDKNLPSVSILIPSRNEEKVIGKLLERIQYFVYPRNKIEVIVINDGSRDSTARIVQEKVQQDKRIKVVNVPFESSGKGKGAALNRGLREASNDVIAVYDADNLPDKDSLRKLCKALLSNKKLAAVTGKFRAYNKDRNFLTRFINIESIAFQWIIQAGRWLFLKISFLPGTNFVIWKSILDEVGGWDEEALTEDSDLTFRIYEKRYLIKFLPTATTWEQEPERLRTWIRQRTRWARGNLFIISTYGKRLFKTKPTLTSIELVNLLYLYYLFIFAILFSDILFILSLLKLIHIRVLGPYALLWAFAFLLFVLEILIALSFEKEDSLKALLLIIAAYLTYTKLWIFVVLKSIFQEFVQKRERVWLKTERYDVSISEANLRIQR